MTADTPTIPASVQHPKPSASQSAGVLDVSSPPITLWSAFGPGAALPSVSAEDATSYARKLAKTRYENFSVVTRLVPPALRDDFAAIYAWCRWSDDIADESPPIDDGMTRLDRLEWWRGRLHELFAGDEVHHPVYVALAPVVRKHSLTVEPFDLLLDAFAADQTVTRYATWDDVVGYCHGSADPVGRLVLALGGAVPTSGDLTTEQAELVRMSDAICTALQLANHWQDVRRDLDERDRVYLPSGETGFDAEALRDMASRPNEPAARVPYIKAVRPLVQRTQRLLDEGRDLPNRLSAAGFGAIAAPVWLFSEGCRAILEEIESNGCATLWRRPTVSKRRKLWLVAQATLRARRASKAGAAS